MRRNKKWDNDEINLLKNLVENTKTKWDDIGSQFGVSGEVARAKYRYITMSKQKAYAFTKIQESPYPKFDSPLEQTGDCLILPDTEFPYHHAEFINLCLELASDWNVRNCVIAGDVLHFDSISKWEANWKEENSGDISEKAHSRLIDLLPDLSESAQEKLLAVMDEFEPSCDNDMGTEVKVSKKALLDIANMFDDIVYVIGNHDGRFLSALNSPMFAEQLKQFVVGDNPKYRIAPYYYSILHTVSGDYRITHPVSSAQTAAVTLANQFHQHIIMGHSHNYSRTLDASGKYWAIQAGCCVDEYRLAYASQRDRGVKRHALGAVIVYNGYPYDLSMTTDWNALKGMFREGNRIRITATQDVR